MKHLLTYLLIVLCTLVSFDTSAQVRVNQQRLIRSLDMLAQFGKDSLGTNRVAYSEADVQARSYVMELMNNAGLSVRIDPAGNIIGTRAGDDPGKKPIATGSHIDTVPFGGNYDGCVGSLAAIEVIHTLQEQGIKTDHPLEVIIFSNEEGGVVGSRAMIGALKPEGLALKNNSGLTVAEGMDAIGGKSSQWKNAIRQKGEMAAFVELHIEQGAKLDNANLDIGVVEGIVGIEVWEVTVHGIANHAGTTPMHMRNDALVAASKLITTINEIITTTEGSQVGTVGMIEVEPGAMNVIPGIARFTLEIRDLSIEKVWQLFEVIKDHAVILAEASGTEIGFELLDISGTPALAHKPFQELIRQSADRLNLSYQLMPSGAGHDAQEIAQIAPMAMIFIPSKNGISHSPKEFSNTEDIANGANVLINTILAIDKQIE